MNDKKNIDRLFQERFKDFEAVPNDKVWGNIHDALHEKKKKKVLPLWWKLSGIAAGLVLAFFVFSTVVNNETTNPSVVEGPKEETIKINVQDKLDLENVVSTKNNLDVDTKNKDIEIKNAAVESIALKNSTLISTENNQKTKSETSAVAVNSNQNTASKLNDNSKGFSKNNTEAKNDQDLNAEKTIASFNNEESANQEIGKTSNFNELNKFKNDSSALATATALNTIEEFLKTQDKNKEAIVEVAENRWQVSTNVAPVYFNSATNGSPIEAQFEENSKSYENNLSVGFGVQYAVNKKLAVRTGLNKVTLGYGTNDVVFFGGLNPSGVSNLSASDATSNIEVISATNYARLKPFEDNLQNTESGVLNQKMGYFEVPLEVSYALIDRKFGLNIIGGFSTLFLNENAVSVQSAKTNMSLGKADNLNDVHFSSNIGLGFKYKIFKQFEAHFEPTLKYQFNTFSRDAGNFKPYYVGLYTGVSYRF